MIEASHSFVLVPWHVGNKLDVTVRALRVVRFLRVFYAEEPESTRTQLESDFGIDCTGKQFLPTPEEPDEAVLRDILGHLSKEDVGLISSGGIPCFVDPGAWIVARLRSEGVPVVALAGPSILSTMLSLSGVDSNLGGTFVSYHSPKGGEAPSRSFINAVCREDEPVYVLVIVTEFADCIEKLQPLIGPREVTVFFDLTRVPREKFPLANRVTTLDCAGWRDEIARIPWDRVSDVAVMIHPRRAR